MLPRSADAALSSQYARSKEIKSGSMSIYWNISGDSIALALEASATGQASNPWTPFTINQPDLSPPTNPSPGGLANHFSLPPAPHSLPFGELGGWRLGWGRPRAWQAQTLFITRQRAASSWTGRSARKSVPYYVYSIKSLYNYF